MLSNWHGLLFIIWPRVFHRAFDLQIQVEGRWVDYCACSKLLRVLLDRLYNLRSFRLQLHNSTSLFDAQHGVEDILLRCRVSVRVVLPRVAQAVIRVAIWILVVGCWGVRLRGHFKSSWWSYASLSMLLLLTRHTSIETLYLRLRLRLIIHLPSRCLMSLEFLGLRQRCSCTVILLLIE